MTPKGHAIPSKTQLLSYGTPAFPKAYLENYKHCLFPTAAAFRVKNPRHPIRNPCFFFGKSLAPGKILHILNF